MTTSSMHRVIQALWAVLLSGLLAAAVTAAGPWAIQALPNIKRPYETYDSVTFVDDKTGWISGFFAGVLKTTDGGRHWTRLDSNLPTEWIANVWFSSKDRGWAVGTSYVDPQKPVHTILATKDGGRSWEVQKRIEEESSWLVDVWFMDDRHGWAVGRREVEGYILSTNDGGLHWEPLFQDREDKFGGEIRRIRFTDPLTGWALSTNAILHTVDGGRTWTVQREEWSLNALELTGSKEAWAVGGWGKLLHTQNGGMKWELSNVAGGEDTYLANVKFVDRYHGWVNGGKGVVFSTVDAGRTWKPEQTNTAHVLGSIATTKAHVFVVAAEEPFQVLVSNR